MAIFSFIDYGKRDFLRYDDGSIIMITCATWEGAESWLHTRGVKYGWTNEGVKYFNWDDEFGDI